MLNRYWTDLTEFAEHVRDNKDIEVTEYSGRGMYGAETWGFIVEDTQGILILGALAMEMEKIHLLEHSGWCSDSMGLDTVIYNKNITKPRG